mmetsp:Transcript_4514/g.16732  ORF Transcript_4514/g.16732 Transcript_4514/m.16732 type:complete len:243 (+) Transcript_4514:3053-3781(+)
MSRRSLRCRRGLRRRGLLRGFLLGVRLHSSGCVSISLRLLLRLRGSTRLFRRVGVRLRLCVGIRFRRRRRGRVRLGLRSSSSRRRNRVGIRLHRLRRVLHLHDGRRFRCLRRLRFRRRRRLRNARLHLGLRRDGGAHEPKRGSLFPDLTAFGYVVVGGAVRLLFAGLVVFLAFRPEQPLFAKTDLLLDHAFLRLRRYGQSGLKLNKRQVVLVARLKRGGFPEIRFVPVRSQLNAFLRVRQSL